MVGQKSGDRRGPLWLADGGLTGETSARTFVGRAAASVIAASIGVLVSGLGSAIATASSSPVGSDLAVYIEAANVVLRGGDIYADSFGSSLLVPLPFTYPPIAALMASPLAYLPSWLTLAVWTCATAVAVGVLIVASSNGRLRIGRMHKSLTYGVAGLCIGLLTPVADTISLGQISAVMVAVVYFSTVAGALDDRGGAGLGVLTAVKLVPGLHVLWLALAGKRRSVARAVASVVLLTLVGAAVLTRSSLDYFLNLLWSPDRIGGRGSYMDVSLAGTAARWGAPGLVGLCAAAVAAALCLYFGLRLNQRDRTREAVVLVGLGAVLATPVAWTHHAVWIVPATFLFFQSDASLFARAAWVASLTPFLLRFPSIAVSLSDGFVSRSLMTTTTVGLAAMAALTVQAHGSARRASGPLVTTHAA